MRIKKLCSELKPGDRYFRFENSDEECIRIETSYLENETPFDSVIIKGGSSKFHDGMEMKFEAGERFNLAGGSIWVEVEPYTVEPATWEGRTYNPGDKYDKGYVIVGKCRLCGAPHVEYPGTLPYYENYEDGCLNGECEEYRYG
jgi:hypothetical protein